MPRRMEWNRRIRCLPVQGSQLSLILGFFPTRLRKDWPLQSWTQRTTSLSEGGETERSAFGWKLAAVSLEGEKGPGAGCSNPTARNASSPGWRGGRGGRRGTGSRARRSCSRGSTCCTRSCARPRGSCIGRRSSWTAAASATAATAGSPRRRRTRRRRPAVARHEHTFNPTSPLKPIKNQETEQLNNHHQVNYLPWRLCSSAREGSRDRWPSRRRRTEAAECGAEGRGRTGGAAFAGKHSAGAASVEPL